MRIRPIHMHTAGILILTHIRTLMVTVIPATMEATTATHTVTGIGAVEDTGAAGVTTAVVATLDGATLAEVMPDADMLAVALRGVALEAAVS